MTNRVRVGRDSYASVEGKGFSAYYGEEYATMSDTYDEDSVDDSASGWGFEAVFGDKKVRIPLEEIGNLVWNDVQSGLLAGIALLFDKYHLEEG